MFRGYHHLLRVEHRRRLERLHVSEQIHRHPLREVFLAPQDPLLVVHLALCGIAAPPICAVGAGLPSGIVGHCRGNTSVSRGVADASAILPGGVTRLDVQRQRAVPVEEIGVGDEVVAVDVPDVVVDAFAPTHCRGSRVQCVASVCVKDVEGMTKLLRTNTAPKIIGLGAEGRRPSPSRRTYRNPERGRETRHSRRRGVGQGARAARGAGGAR